MQDRPKNRALLAQFTIELTQDGRVCLENSTVNPEAFRKAMDEWNRDYEGTLALTNMLREVKLRFEELSDQTYKSLR